MDNLPWRVRPGPPDLKHRGIEVLRVRCNLLRTRLTEFRKMAIVSKIIDPREPTRMQINWQITVHICIGLEELMPRLNMLLVSQVHSQIRRGGLAQDNPGICAGLSKEGQNDPVPLQSSRL